MAETSEANQRAFPRKTVLVKTNFFYQTRSFRGKVLNLSKNGLKLETVHAFQKGTILRFELPLGPRILRTEGAVVYVLEPRPNLYHHGIHFTKSAPTEYDDLTDDEKLEGKAPENRDQARKEVEIHTHFRFFYDHYNARIINLSKGGMLLETNVYFPKGSELVVDVPLRNQIYQVKGRVRHFKQIRSNVYRIGVEFSNRQKEGKAEAPPPSTPDISAEIHRPEPEPVQPAKPLTLDLPTRSSTRINLGSGGPVPPELVERWKSGKGLSHYEILGIRQTATPQHIEKAYQEIAAFRAEHPGDAPPPEQVQEAYNALKDLRRRAEYDEELERSRVRHR